MRRTSKSNVRRLMVIGLSLSILSGWLWSLVPPPVAEYLNVDQVAWGGPRRGIKLAQPSSMRPLASRSSRDEPRPAPVRAVSHNEGSDAAFDSWADALPDDAPADLESTSQQLPLDLPDLPAGDMRAPEMLGPTPAASGIEPAGSQHEIVSPDSQMPTPAKREFTTGSAPADAGPTFDTPAYRQAPAIEMNTSTRALEIGDSQEPGVPGTFDSPAGAPAAPRADFDRHGTATDMTAFDNAGPAPVKSADFEPQRFQAPQRLAAISDANHDDVSIRWISPDEANVGEPVDCELVVYNRSEAPVFDVAVAVEVPSDVQLRHVDSEPVVTDGRLQWQFQRLGSHEQKKLRLALMPTAQGSLQPVAKVTFTRAAAAEISVLRPRLELRIEGPQTVVLGQPSAVLLTVSNPGSGSARNVIVEASFDGAALDEMSGPRQYRIGSLEAGQIRQVRVPVTGHRAGAVRIIGRAKAEGAELSVGAQHELRITSPRLDLVINSPRMRFVNRQARVQLLVRNPGESAAHNVQVFCQVPEGLRFVEASAGGTFDEAARHVSWFLGEVAERASGELTFEVTPETAGNFDLQCTVRNDGGTAGNAATAMRVEGISSLRLDIHESDDPVEVAGETTYEIRVTNDGSYPARHVEVAAIFPVELSPIDSETTGSAQIEGQQARFAEIPQLDAGQSHRYLIRTRCNTAGQVRVRAFVRSETMPDPLVEEELTRVYQD